MLGVGFGTLLRNDGIMVKWVGRHEIKKLQDFHTKTNKTTLLRQMPCTLVAA